MQHPALAEVTAYLTERNSAVDGEKFWAYYESQGWKKGNGLPLVSWKAAVITWEKSERKNSVTQKQTALEMWSLARKAAKAWSTTVGALYGSPSKETVSRANERWGRILESLPPRLVEICEQFGWKSIASPINEEVARGQFFKAYGENQR